MMRRQRDIVPSPHVSVFGEAQRVALNDLFCKSLRNSGGGLERGEDGGGGSILNLRRENICISVERSSSIHSRPNRGWRLFKQWSRRSAVKQWNSGPLLGGI